MSSRDSRQTKSSTHSQESYFYLALAAFVYALVSFKFFYYDSASRINLFHIIVILAVLTCTNFTLALLVSFLRSSVYPVSPNFFKSENDMGNREDYRVAEEKFEAHELIKIGILLFICLFLSRFLGLTILLSALGTYYAYVYSRDSWGFDIGAWIKRSLFIGAISYAPLAQAYIYRLFTRIISIFAR